MPNSVHYPSSRPPTRPAFSLIEVIIVIGIIGLLMALLLPALRGARENAKTIQCASQLRQLGQAFHMYANTNKGYLPDWSGWHVYPDGSSPEDAPGLGWVEKMEPYLSPTSKVYNCPSFPIPMYNYFIAAEWAGINGMHSFKYSDIRMASRMIISADMTQPNLYPIPYGNSQNPTDDCDRDDFGGNCLCFPEQGGFLMHRTGNNVLFDDNHVDTFRFYDPLKITFHPWKMASWYEVRDGGPDMPN